MNDLASLPNLGTEMLKKLAFVGISDEKELRKMGSKSAFILLKTAYPNVCLVHLYCLEGALQGLEYNNLPEQLRSELKEFSDGLKEA